MSVIIESANDFSYLKTDDEALKLKLWKILRFRDKNYAFNAAYRMKVWDGFKDFFDKNSGKFLSGLLPDVMAALKVWGITYELKDNRGTFDFTVNTVDENFLPGITLRDYQVDYINQSLKLRRGLVCSQTGCHRIGQGILLYDGNIKTVENIEVGDKLMGPDSKPRTVENLCRGNDVMYRIVPAKGIPFVVNGDHVLSLICTNPDKRTNKNHCKEQLVDVTVKNWLMWSKSKKLLHKLSRTSVEFSSVSNLLVDPYLLGVLISAGSTDNGHVSIATADEEIVQYCRNQVILHNMDIRVNHGTRTPSYSFTVADGKDNQLIEDLSTIGAYGKRASTKSIPFVYKTAKRADRLALLAGLIDAHGSYSGRYDYVSKSECLANDVCYLARSLGFAAYMTPCRKTSQYDTAGECFRVSISGDLSVVPCLLNRKKATPRLQKKSVLRTGFIVEKLDTEQYYGFTLAEEPHYLLDDFTITHNSGKTNVLIGILKAIPPGTPTLILCNKTDLVEQNFDEIKKFGFNDVGRVHGKKKEIDKTILCVTWQSIKNVKHLLKKFKVLIVDEVHDMMSPKVKMIYRVMTNACVRIGFSATAFKFGGTDEVQKYATKGFFGPPLYCKSAEGGKLTTLQLQERNILSTATFTFYKVKKPDLPYEIYQDAVTKGVAENTHFHEIVTQLTHMLKGRTIIMVERIEHGDMLKKMLPDAAWVSGKDDTKTRKEVKERLKYGTGNVVAIATTGIFNTGINVFVHNFINAAGGKADHAIIQRLGRGLRPSEDKEILRYFDFYFTINKYLESHSIKRIKVLKKEGHKINLLDDFDFNQVRIG
jgi:superfamily II DNA or RNA helicase